MAERNAVLRNAWIGIKTRWSADQLVFLDESAANERTGDGGSMAGHLLGQFVEWHGDSRGQH